MPTFSRSAYDEIISRSRSGGDLEVCGVLGGSPDPTYRDSADERANTDPAKARSNHVVTAVYPVENVASNPRSRYELEPESQLEAIQHIEANDQTVVGFYHSHPRGPPRPSITDVDAATWPDASYVIVSLDGEPFVGSWRWDGEQETFIPELVQLVG